MMTLGVSDGLGRGGYEAIGLIFLAAYVAGALLIVGVIALIVWLIRGSRTRRSGPQPPS
jgi:hypothetical protein